MGWQGARRKGAMLCPLPPRVGEGARRAGEGSFERRSGGRRQAIAPCEHQHFVLALIRASPTFSHATAREKARCDRQCCTHRSPHGRSRTEKMEGRATAQGLAECEKTGRKNCEAQDWFAAAILGSNPGLLFGCIRLQGPWRGLAPCASSGAPGSCPGTPAGGLWLP